MQADETDYYKLLGVPYNATPEQITRAYRTAMKRAHPDRHDAAQRAAAEERAKLLNLAYKTLSRPESRRAYDASRRAAVVQDEIMGRYVGGFGGPGMGAHDPFARNLRRAQSEFEKKDQAAADRSAVTSMVFIFGGATVLVIVAVILYALISAALRAAI